MSRQRKKHPMIVERQKSKKAHGWKHQPRWRQRRNALVMEAHGKATVPGLLELFREIWDVPGALWNSDIERIRKGWKNE